MAEEELTLYSSISLFLYPKITSSLLIPPFYPSTFNSRPCHLPPRLFLT